MLRRLLFGFLFTTLSAFSLAHAESAARSATAVLHVENTTCSACPITVRKALEKVPGVNEVKVDLKAQSATVHFDPAKTSVEALTTATANAGYPSRVKE